jgi:DNA helicase TIP49 (TBP-interacting protein)
VQLTKFTWPFFSLFIVVASSVFTYAIMLIAGLRIKETKEVYEGEVTELTPVETENPMGGENVKLYKFNSVFILCIRCSV